MPPRIRPPKQPVVTPTVSLRLPIGRLDDTVRSVQSGRFSFIWVQNRPFTPLCPDPSLHQACHPDCRSENWMTRSDRRLNAFSLVPSKGRSRIVTRHRMARREARRRDTRRSPWSGQQAGHGNACCRMTGLTKASQRIMPHKEPLRQQCGCDIVRVSAPAGAVRGRLRRAGIDGVLRRLGCGLFSLFRAAPVIRSVSATGGERRKVEGR